MRLERAESGERDAIEGKFAEGRHRFSPGLVMTRLQKTSETRIHLVFLVMKLRKILRDLLFFFSRSGFRWISDGYGWQIRDEMRNRFRTATLSIA